MYTTLDMGIAIKLNNTTLAEVDTVESIACLQQIVCAKLVSAETAD